MVRLDLSLILSVEIILPLSHYVVLYKFINENNFGESYKIVKSFAFRWIYYIKKRPLDSILLNDHELWSEVHLQMEKENEKKHH